MAMSMRDSLSEVRCISVLLSSHHSSSDMYEKLRYLQSDNILSSRAVNKSWSNLLLIILSHAILLCLGAGPSRTYGHARFGLALLQEADKPLWRRHFITSPKWAKINGKPTNKQTRTTINKNPFGLARVQEADKHCEGDIFSLQSHSDSGQF